MRMDVQPCRLRTKCIWHRGRNNADDVWKLVGFGSLAFLGTPIYAIPKSILYYTPLHQMTFEAKSIGNGTISELTKNIMSPQMKSALENLVGQRPRLHEPYDTRKNDYPII